MKKRSLPGTDLVVSEVCLGTMTWGQQNDEREAHAQLDCAMAHGVNFIDTAEMYPIPPAPQTQGRTEIFLGSWIARQRRSELILASKVAGPGRGRDWVRGGRTAPAHENIGEALEGSLRRLRTDYLDLYQIHWPQRNVPMFGAREFDPAAERPGPAIVEQVEALARLVREGKIRHYGLANETAWGLCEFQRVARELGVPGPVTLQNPYNLVLRTVDQGIAEVLHHTNMSLLAYSPLAAGLLTGKYLRPETATGRFSLFPHWGERWRNPLLDEVVRAFAELAARHGRSLVQLALGYVRSRWYTGATIVGATTVTQLIENIAAAQHELDAETLAAIAAIHARYPSAIA